MQRSPWAAPRVIRHPGGPRGRDGKAVGDRRREGARRPTSLGRRKSTRRRRAMPRPSVSVGVVENFNVRGGWEFGFGARVRNGRKCAKNRVISTRCANGDVERVSFTERSARLRRECGQANLSHRCRPPSDRGKCRPTARPASVSRRGCRSTADRRFRRRGDTSGA